MRAQLTQALDNLETVLREAGLDLSNVVRLNHYTIDIDAFFEGYEVGATRLRASGARVSSSAVGVACLALPPLLVEIEGDCGRVTEAPRPAWKEASRLTLA